MKKLIIEKDKLRHNIEVIHSMTSSRIIAVLKGNGYGLGLVDYARFLLENGIDFFAVSDLSEALTLRGNGITCEILLLTSTCFVEEAELLASNNIIATVGSVKSMTAADEAGKKLGATVDVHLKIDTGFGRFGFLRDQLGSCSDLFKSFSNIRISGTYSHLSFAFAKDPKVVHTQFQRFISCLNELRENGIDPGMTHIANSSAFLRFDSMHLDAVRVGSALLGRIPVENRYGLNRIGYMLSRVIEIKDLPSGSFIGYANTLKLKKNARIGIVPVGYKDGFGVEKVRDTFRPIDVLRYIYNDMKSLNRKLYVTIKGQKARILGRISMYNIIVDLTGLDVEIGDDVMLNINPILVESTIEREYV